MADEPRVTIDVIGDPDDPDVIDLTDEVRAVARGEFPDVVRVRVEGMDGVLKDVDSSQAVELAKSVLDAARAKVDVAREIAERDAEVEKARIRAAERVAVRQESDRLRRFFDAHVEADTRAATAEAVRREKSRRPGAAPQGHRGSELKEYGYADQQRILKGLRPHGLPGRAEPKPEPSALEKLQKRVGL